jgi:hypothetical protein
MPPDTAEVTEAGSRIPTWPQIPPKFTRQSHLSVDATANHLFFCLWKQRNLPHAPLMWRQVRPGRDNCPGSLGIWSLQQRYNHGYTNFMKTAISIPDSVFEEAERLAKTRGWSRSELYANAVTAYVKSERFSGVREKLDAVYGPDAEDSAIDPLLAEAQARSLSIEKW